MVVWNYGTQGLGLNSTAQVKKDQGIFSDQGLHTGRLSARQQYQEGQAKSEAENFTTLQQLRNH